MTDPIGDSDPIPTLAEGERRLIQKALEKCNGRLSGPRDAAVMLGVNRSTLWSRMQKLGIDWGGVGGAGRHPTVGLG